MAEVEPAAEAVLAVGLLGIPIDCSRLLFEQVTCIRTINHVMDVFRDICITSVMFTCMLHHARPQQAGCRRETSQPATRPSLRRIRSPALNCLLQEMIEAISTYTYIYVYVQICMCVCVYIYICSHRYMHVYTYI